MERLVAKYQIELAAPFLVKRAVGVDLKYCLNIDDAEVELLLIPDESHKGKGSNERIWSFEVRSVQISVSLPETKEPPPADITPKNGKGSYYEIEQYFESRLPRFTEIAVTAFQRLVRYFKYKQGMLYLSDYGASVHEFPLPSWSDESGRPIWKSRSRAVFVSHIPGFHQQEFGIKKFRKNDDKKLVRALEKNVEITLYEEILSDAQTAILHENYRRGILEMAIACEIAIKQAFFAESTVSGAAYEYLENKGRVQVRITELISGVAEHTFGESFKQFDATAYSHLDFLFRCRNQIAHRGEAVFRDDRGEWHQPDMKTLKEWWESVETMLDWLGKQRLK